MADSRAGYKGSTEYQAYLNGGTRPPDEFMPTLSANDAGETILMPGEVYCRMDSGLGSLCSCSLKYSCESALRKHYKRVHAVEVERRRTAGLRPSQTPRKSTVDSPEPNPFGPVHRAAGFALVFWQAKVDAAADLVEINHLQSLKRLLEIGDISTAEEKDIGAIASSTEAPVSTSNPPFHLDPDTSLATEDGPFFE